MLIKLVREPGGIESVTAIFHVIVELVPLILDTFRSTFLFPEISQNKEILSKFLFWYNPSLNQFQLTDWFAIALKWTVSLILIENAEELSFVLLLLHDMMAGRGVSRLPFIEILLIFGVSSRLFVNNSTPIQPYLCWRFEGRTYGWSGSAFCWTNCQPVQILLSSDELK